jgi:hypothetical protein
MDSKFFFSSFCYYSGGLNCYRYNQTFQVPHSLYLFTCTFVFCSFPASFARHFCPQVLPNLSICMFSLFLFLIIMSVLLAVTSLSVVPLYSIIHIISIIFFLLLPRRLYFSNNPLRLRVSFVILLLHSRLLIVY